MAIWWGGAMEIARYDEAARQLWKHCETNASGRLSQSEKPLMAPPDRSNPLLARNYPHHRGKSAPGRRRPMESLGAIPLFSICTLKENMS